MAVLWYNRGGKNMIEKLKEILRHRQLILILVSRELKARYRGTMFGFLWSLFNPLLLMLVYTVVFGFIVSGGRVAGFASTKFYALFLFNGILPWTWFSSSMIESSNVLMVHGALIKKIKFPIEVLPIMVVATNMVHFILALPVLIFFFLIFGKPLTLWVLFLPISLLVQFIFTMGSVLSDFGADRSFQGYKGYSFQPVDPVVFRYADHLYLRVGTQSAENGFKPQSHDPSD